MLETFILIVIWLVVAFFLLKFILRLFGVSLGVMVGLICFLWKHKVPIIIFGGLALIITIIITIIE